MRRACYHCEVHHIEEWAHVKETDVNKLTLGCGSHHPLVEPGGWTTRKSANGDTEWIPPPHLDCGQPCTNSFHHPENPFATKTRTARSTGVRRFATNAVYLGDCALVCCVIGAS
jgi:hypothetical protein